MTTTTAAPASVLAAATPIYALRAEPTRLHSVATAVLRNEDGEPDGRMSIVGLACATDMAYEMYDWAGPYHETVASGAFAHTLATNPEVVLTINHTGLGLAHTIGGTLRLEEAAAGLWYYADLDPGDAEAASLLRKIERGDVRESSFFFRIREQRWSPDYTERTIDEVDLNRGDVAAVTYGANPHTSIALARRQGAGPTQLAAPTAARLRDLTQAKSHDFRADGCQIYTATGRGTPSTPERATPDELRAAGQRRQCAMARAEPALWDGQRATTLARNQIAVIVGPQPPDRTGDHPE